MCKWSAVRSGAGAAAALFLSLTVSGAALADGEAVVESIPVAVGCQADGRSVGKVVALTGVAHVQAPDGALRSLACDDLVRQCDTLITSPGARLGILSGEVYAQIDAETRLQVALREEAPNHRLESGGVRLIDARSQGPRFEVDTPHVATRGLGSDTELWVALVRGTPQTRVCNHASSVDVALMGEAGRSAMAGPRACIEADAVSLRTLEGADPQIGVATPEECPFLVAGPQLTPTDVAAPPFGPSFPGVDPAEAFRRSPCDDPGSGCAGEPRVPPVPPRRRTPPPDSFIIRQNPPGTPPCGIPGFPCAPE